MKIVNAGKETELPNTCMFCLQNDGGKNFKRYSSQKRPRALLEDDDMGGPSVRWLDTCFFRLVTCVHESAELTAFILVK